MSFRFLLILGVVSFASLSQCAFTQTVEVSGNYSFVLYNPAGSEAYDDLTDPKNPVSHSYDVAGAQGLNGGGGSVGFALGDYFTLKGEVEDYLTTTFNFTYPATNPPGYQIKGLFNPRGSMLTYLFGPQVNIPMTKKRVFGEVLLGGARSDLYANLFSDANVTNFHKSQDGLALALGFGLDFGIAKRVALRPIQVDYLMTRYHWYDPKDATKNLGINNQNNFRYQAGLVFRLGKAS